MSFGSDIARGFASQLGWLLLAAVLFGAVAALGLYFGGSWVYEHVNITVG